MLLRSSSVRPLTLLLVALCALFVAACGPGAERTQTNNAASATPAAVSTPTALPAGAATPAADASPPGAGAVARKLNVNTASRQELLAAVPNLGDRMVHEFEEYRPYRSIQQFRREIGKYVDEAKVAEYERYVFVPISENDSDAATLRQIPGLDASEAEQLIAGRPYPSRDAFLSRLAGMVSEAEMAEARAYLNAR